MAGRQAVCFPNFGSRRGPPRPELLTARILHIRRTRVNLTTHCTRQIEFDARNHWLGLTDLAMMEMVVILINRKKQMISPLSRIILDRVDLRIMFHRVRFVYQIFAIA